MDFFRETALGQTIRFLTRNKALQYPEERAGFRWQPLDDIIAGEDTGIEPRHTANEPSRPHMPDATEPQDLEKKEIEGQLNSNRSKTREGDATSEGFGLKQQPEIDAEQQLQIEKPKSNVITPTKTPDGNILVDWYTADDPENPQNWSKMRKLAILIPLCLYTSVVYGASSMYIAGQEGVMERFNVGPVAASLGLAIYVVGYGIGPLLWAPLSEIAVVGRNWVYIPSFFFFIILSIPTATINNYSGLLVLRFLTGFLGSPCLANGGASIGDIFDFIELPMYISAWTGACFWGPALGPVLTSFAVQAEGWRWSLWEIVWLSAPIFVVFFISYPETSADTILQRRAQRLRKRTGLRCKTRGEIAQAEMKPIAVIWDAIIKPTEIMIKDPAVLFTNVYTSLTYGTYYTFFEAFPLVYPPIYNFNLGETGLAFLVIGPSTVIAVSIFLLYQIYSLIPDIRKSGLHPPEHRLVPALFGVVFVPVGLFIFAWTTRYDVHWIVSLIGVGIMVIAQFFNFQSVFIYLPLSYPKYAASLFAANDLLRSLFAAGCVAFARPMFLNLGVGGGVSLLAGLSCLGVLGMFYLWRYGAWLRSKSKFAHSGI